MKTTIYYFTGTGSSLAVAKAVAEGLGQCNIISISSIAIDDYVRLPERVGFILPNYYGSIPTPVKRFISQLDFSDTRYTFAIINAGGNPGMGLAHLRQFIQNQGGELHYSQFLRHGSNYIVAPYYTMMNLHGKGLQKNLERNRVKIRSIVDDITNREHSLPSISGIGYALTQLFYGSRLQENALNIAADFSVSEDCTNCGICSKVCPVQNIQMSNSGPIWQGSCEDCCACIQLCRSEAILLRGKKLNKRRYLHPEVTVKELVTGNSGQKAVG